ncbi:MAG: NHLP leader peptide family RiPP precursor [Caldilineaceae bacterium]|nr:NHLP leader peptide family RiPP precursor [Caldilineaceae bacterium]
MITTLTSSREELEARLVKRANADPAFRQRLLDDPKAAIADVLGVSLPPGMTITVLEEAPGHHYLILPPAPLDLDALPLDDLELALVGGGRTMRPHAIKCGVSNTRASASNARSSQRSSC